MGNSGYGNRSNHSNLTVNTKTYMAVGDSAVVFTANILQNTAADEYLMTIALADEGTTLKEATNKLQQRLESFTNALKALTIKPQDYYIDFIAQHKIYDYEVVNNTLLQEKLKGFIVKKNIMIRFADRTLIEKIQLLAADFQIYDIVKIDYRKHSAEQLRQEMWEEALKVIEKKKKNYIQFTEHQLTKSFVVSENFLVQVPSEMYESYKAYEAGTATDYEYEDYRNRLKKVNLRKMTTFYLNPMSANGFDKVLNPMNIEPTLQYVYQLEVRYVIKK
jgi:uncharacterized protein YggE